MANPLILSPDDWTDYELIDSGNGLKLERFENYTVVRPDPRVLWKPRRSEEIWQNADARYIRSTAIEGHWDIKTPPPSPWRIRYRDMMFTLEPTTFKHIGIFPEQAVNWTWIHQRIAGRPLRILNLFAYTGAASIAAAKAGAHVTHLDSVKSAITWANENAKLNPSVHRQIRWIEDDAVTFVGREQKRGSVYDGIILDPPRFGRGNKGQVWKLMDDIPRLLDGCRNLLSRSASFFLVNAYTADISAIALGQLVASVMKDRNGSVSFGELALKESDASGRLLPSGIFARWIP